jgi:hypothetical protein
MNTIGMCREIPDLPEAIKRDLDIARMVTLEDNLRRVNPLFEQDTYLAIMERLAVVYYRINRQNPKTLTDLVS